MATCFPSSDLSKHPHSLSPTEIQLCSDVDELPAYSTEDKWASLFEVIAPYKALCRVPVPEGYTTRTSWPESMWEIPLANVPKATLWQSGQIKSTQNWIKVINQTI